VFDKAKQLTTVILVSDILVFAGTIWLGIKALKKVKNIKLKTSDVIVYSETYSILSLRIIRLAQVLIGCMIVI